MDPKCHVLEHSKLGWMANTIFMTQWHVTVIKEHRLALLSTIFSTYIMLPVILNGSRNLKMEYRIIAHLLDQNEDHH